MKNNPTKDPRLIEDRNVWFATVREDGRPHLVPLWFVWSEGVFYICVQEKSVKVKNISKNAKASLSLQDGDKPIICEGRVERVQTKWPGGVVDEFSRKYDWNILTDDEYQVLFRISPKKWLSW